MPSKVDMYYVLCIFECISNDHVGEGEGGVTARFDVEWIGVSGCSHGGMGSSGVVARVSSLTRCE
jgi:hypothetical protein